jgi:hypothetical protein
MMARAKILAGLVVLGLAPTARAASPRWEVSASALVGTPAVLVPGVALGATAEVQRRLGSTPVFLSARLGWMAASAANQSWTIDHHQPMGAVGLGLTGALGAGRFWAQAGGGASGVYERLGRHQRLRIDAAGVPGGVETSWALGPCFFGELGVAVRLRGAVGGLLAGGPTVVRTEVDGRLKRGSRWRWPCWAAAASTTDRWAASRC